MGTDIISPIQKEEVIKHNGTLAIDKDYPYSRRNPETKKPVQSLDNYIIFIQNHPDLKGILRYNMFSSTIEVEGNSISDEHISRFRRIFERDSALTPTKKEYVIDAILYCAKEYGSYDPILDRLMSIKDCYTPGQSMPQLKTWLAKVLKQNQSEYLSIVGETMVRLIVRRQIRPGSHSPFCFSLIGGQGVGKTFFPGTLIQPLAPPNSIRGEEMVRMVERDFESPDALAHMNKGLIALFDEGSAVSRSEIEKVKKFITTDIDGYRKAYARFDVEQLRRFTVFLTDNRMQFLTDDENRRFLPIEFTELYNYDLLKRISKQLLAEALYEETREDFSPIPEFPKGMLAEQQSRFIDSDVWDEAISNLLKSKTVYINNPTKFTIGHIEIWGHLTRQEGTDIVDVRSFGQREKMRINKIMKRLGFISGVQRINGVLVRKFSLPGYTTSEVDDNIFDKIKEAEEAEEDEF